MKDYDTREREVRTFEAETELMVRKAERAEELAKFERGEVANMTRPNEMEGAPRPTVLEAVQGKVGHILQEAVFEAIAGYHPELMDEPEIQRLTEAIGEACMDVIWGPLLEDIKHLVHIAATPQD